MEVTRIFDLLPYQAEKFNKNNILAGKENGKWKEYSTKQYVETSNNISYGLLALGVKKGDRIASITNSCPEWNFLDMGVLQTGAIHIPIYPTISDKDYRYILQHSQAKYIFVAGEEILRRISHIIPEIPSIKEIYTFKNIDKCKHLNELIDLGKNNKDEEKLNAIKSSIDENDIATIIYTSGTMGIPKGVMLSHKNLLSNVKATSVITPYGIKDKDLSYLPLCHIYERMMNYMFQYIGVSLYYAESIGTIVDNLKEVKPIIMTTVPRVLEKLFDKIMAKGRKFKGIKRKVFNWAVKLGFKYELNAENGWWYELRLKIARMLVFKKWHKSLGDNLDIIVSGGAALQPRLCRIFWAAGFRIMEGYGLSETSPVIAVNNFDPNGIKFGTVGPPLQGVDVKIAQDGEILCKGPNVMLGYYKAPELTKKVIDKDGWFHTGDIGYFTKQGQLKITGRKKLIFKTSFGKYISPQILENKFKESPFIDQMMVVGENQKFPAAIIVPDFENIEAWCKENDIEYISNKHAVNLPEVKKLFQNEINKYNLSFGATEKIKKFKLIDKQWTIKTDELSATLKLRRTYLKEKYKDLIDKIYSS